MSDIEKSSFEVAEYIVGRAYDMYPQKHQPDPYKVFKDPFPMYSFERAATMFWTAFVEELVNRGKTESEIEEILCSKDMRWMFDSAEIHFAMFAKSLIDQFDVDA